MQKNIALITVLFLSACAVKPNSLLPHSIPPKLLNLSVFELDEKFGQAELSWREKEIEIRRFASTIAETPCTLLVFLAPHKEAGKVEKNGKEPKIKEGTLKVVNMLTPLPQLQSVSQCAKAIQKENANGS